MPVRNWPRWLLGLLDARIVRPGAQPRLTIPPHEGELVFGFILQGTARLAYRGDHVLETADAFVIPPAESLKLVFVSEDFQMLHVATARLPSS